jgi:bifunctional non-homologous end joining protein LigD
VTERLRVGRRTIELSKPNKVLFPDSGVTKLDLARYWERVAEVALPHLRDRPLNLQRFPDGIEGEGFFQQRASDWFPNWIERARVAKAGGAVEHVLANEAATLVYLAGQAVTTLHAWPSRADRLDRPDRLVFDLDPSDGDFGSIRARARDFGDLLRELGLEPFAMLTGSRGVHVTVPLQRRHSFDEVRGFAREVAELMAARHPDCLTLEQRKAKRRGRILIDVMRNAYAHTAVAPYSVRARPGAPVAAPLEWEELTNSRLKPDRYTVRNLFRRLSRRGDPWSEIARHARSLGAPRRLLHELREETT